MRHIWWVSAIVILALTGLARAAGDEGPSLASVDKAPTQAPDDAVLGKADAPITIFEYASLGCPHCADFDANTLPDVKKNWLDTGKAKLIFRDFPLDGHAVKAAMLARCAPPDRFYAFVDVLFHTQLTWWTPQSDDGVLQALSKIARLGGISEDKFNSCINDKALLDRISNEEMTAQKDYGVNSTPTFFINGKKLMPLGFMPYDDFAKALTLAQASAGMQHFAAAPQQQRK
jgi:protein-disulfide isomerase